MPPLPVLGAWRRGRWAPALPRLILLDGGTLTATDLASLAQWVRVA